MVQGRHTNFIDIRLPGQGADWCARPTQMRKALLSALLVLLFALCIPGSGRAHTAGPRPAKVGAAAALVMEARTGRILYARNADQRLPPASTTKIMTALLLARAVPPNTPVPTSPYAAATPGSALHLRPGERIPARDLLYAIVLISANDASVAAAEYMAGSEPAFVARMNAEARRMGAANTHFANPHGLEKPGHYSTVRDLAIMAREAMRNPQFAAAVRTRAYTLPRDGGRPATQLKNKNELLWSLPGTEGVKTGWTRSAGFCLVGSATRNGRRVISVVLNSPDWKGETRALIDYGYAALAAGGKGAAGGVSANTSDGGASTPSTAAVGPKSLANGAPLDEDVPDEAAARAHPRPSAQQPASPPKGAHKPGGSRPRGVAGPRHSPAKPARSVLPGAPGTGHAPAKPATGGAAPNAKPGSAAHVNPGLPAALGQPHRSGQAPSPPAGRPVGSVASSGASHGSPGTPGGRSLGTPGAPARPGGKGGAPGGRQAQGTPASAPHPSTIAGLPAGSPVPTPRLPSAGAAPPGSRAGFPAGAPRGSAASPSGTAGRRPGYAGQPAALGRSPIPSVGQPGVPAYGPSQAEQGRPGRPGQLQGNPLGPSATGSSPAAPGNAPNSRASGSPTVPGSQGAKPSPPSAPGSGQPPPGAPRNTPNGAADRPAMPGAGASAPSRSDTRSGSAPASATGNSPGKSGSAPASPGTRGQTRPSNRAGNTSPAHGARDDRRGSGRNGNNASGGVSGQGFKATEKRVGAFPWLWLALIVLAAIAVALLRKLRGSWSFRMNKPSFDMSGMWNRKKKDPVVHTVAAPMEVDNRQHIATVPPAFLFCPPAIARKSAAEWLLSVLETPRLLEPFIRRQARAVLDANPRGCLEKTLELLASPTPKVRLAAAELVASHAPRRSEQTLTALIEDEKTAADIRNEAVEMLAETTGDRYEELFTAMLLEDGSAPAARALARLPRLEESTRETLREKLEAERLPFRDSNAELRSNLMLGQIACVLAAHAVVEPDAAEKYLERLPANHREQVVTMVLRGSHSEWAIGSLVDTLLTARPYPALQALMECDPMQVRAILEACSEGLDAAARTRCLITKWVLWGDGDEEGIRRLAEAGNDFAAGALNLSRTQHWDPAGASSESLLAASFIYSLRIGFSDYPQEKVAAIFRSASDDSAYAVLSESPELKPLAQVYARPEVYEAVQAAMHTEDGLNCLMAALARQPDNRAYQDECAFWSDKSLAPTRLHLLHALSAGQADANHAAMAARAKDPCSQIGAMVLRFLRTHSASGSKHAAAAPAPEELPTPDELPDPPQSIDRAA